MLKNLLSLFLKPNCPLCQRPADEVVCKYCANKLKTCQLNDCSIFWQGDLPVFIWGQYGGYLKRAIAAFKYDLKPEMGELFGTLLAKAWLDARLHLPAHKITVLPIPLHGDRQKERGFNQAELIARRFCEITKYDLKPFLLQRIRNTEAMFGLNSTQREENIKQAFTLGKDFQRLNSNSSVLIIDDIYTTGTTAKEACQVLQNHQIKIVGIAAIASSRILM